MKRNLYLLILILWSFTSVAMGEKSRRQNNQDRIPSVSIIKAIQLTIDHHKLHSEIGDIFIDEAIYIRTKNELLWKIGVRLKSNETGHIYYKVTPDEKVETYSVVKDG